MNNPIALTSIQTFTILTHMRQEQEPRGEWRHPDYMHHHIDGRSQEELRQNFDYMHQEQRIGEWTVFDEQKNRTSYSSYEIALSPKDYRERVTVLNNFFKRATQGGYKTAVPPIVFDNIGVTEDTHEPVFFSVCCS